MKPETKQSIVRLLVSVLIIGGIIGVAYLILYLLGWTNITQEELQAFVASTGAVAPLIFILISFLQVTFVPIPGAVTILAGNYVFGALEAFIYSYIGMMAGSILAFALGRWIGRPFVNWISGGQEKTDEWIAKLKGREVVLLFFMFFLPFFPDDILCSVAGILPIGWFGFILMQLITRITSVGFTLLLMSGEFIPWHGWGLVVLAVIAVLAVLAFIISYRNADRINQALIRASDRITAKFRKEKKEEK